MPRMAQFARVREPPRMDGAEPKVFHGYGDAYDSRIPPFYLRAFTIYSQIIYTLSIEFAPTLWYNIGTEGGEPPLNTYLRGTHYVRFHR